MKIKSTFILSKNIILVLSTFLFLAGCTWTSHEANINIAQPAVQAGVANGEMIFFSILDDRDEATIGNRGVGRMGAKVTAQDPIGKIETVLRQGLLEKGYVLVNNQRETDKKLLVRVRAINFHHESGFWSGSENTTVIISAEAENSNRDYRQTYRYNDVDKAQFAAGAKEIDAHLNDGLNTVVAALLNDRDLDYFLMDDAE